LNFPRIAIYFGWILTAAFLVFGTGCQRLMSALTPPRRLADVVASIVLPESIVLERSAAGTSLTLSFETNVAAACKVGFRPAGSSASIRQDALMPCVAKSTTKFSEVISGLPADQLVTIFIKAWPASATEPVGGLIKIAEAPPTADAKTINMVLADLDARWVELTTIDDARTPSDVIADFIKPRATTCTAMDGKERGLDGARKATFIQSATFRGLFNTTLARISTSALGSSFNMTQRDSAEWTVTAKTAAGFGQLRLAKPALLIGPIFAAAQQSEGLDDDLADIDPPVIKILGGSTVVTTWTIDGDSKNTLITLTVQRAPGFPGIVCTANAATGRIVIPAELVTKIPTGLKLWATLRLDSWQGLDKERWLVRASSWTSMGLHRL
jgi:hypothetical protein